MRFAPFILVFTSVIALSGCSTFEGLKEDISSGYHSLTDSIAKTVDPVKEAKKQLPVYDGTCPPVSVRPDLKHLVDFHDPAKASESTKVSEVDILDVQNTCRVENGGLVMQIDISLQGKTGPKARFKPGDKPSFAYPYFVAVTDAQGNVVSKEIFAASVSYGSKQNDINQTESVFQTMPYPDATIGQTYNVIVGWQLTEDQLAYNQRIASMPVDSTPAAQPQSPPPAPKPAAKPEGLKPSDLKTPS